MRVLMLSLLAFGAANVASVAPAAAYDYPYCLQGGGYGIPGDCSYATYAQCKASASGRRADCNINPRVAFRQQRERAPRGKFRQERYQERY